MTNSNRLDSDLRLIVSFKLFLKNNYEKFHITPYMIVSVAYPWWGSEPPHEPEMIN